MKEQLIVNKRVYKDGQPHYTSVADYLLRLQDEDNFTQAKELLESAEEKFKEADWTGGLNGSSIEEVVSMFSDIHSGELSPHLISANDTLAIFEAIQFAGINIKEDLFVHLRRKARQEQASIEAYEKGLEKKQKPRKRISPKLTYALFTIMPAAIVIATRPWEYFQTPHLDDDTNESNSQRLTETVNSLPIIQGEVLPKKEQELSLKDFGESIFVKKITKVEELEVKREGRFKFYGINFSVLKEIGGEIKKDEIIRLTWAGEGVTAKRGSSLEIISAPLAIESGVKFPDDCLRRSELDCVLAFEKFAVSGGHSGVVEHVNKEGLTEKIELTGEAVRAFIGGHKLQKDGTYLEALTPQEREAIIALLEKEEERPTLSQGEVQVKVAVAVVRIEEAYLDDVYKDWSKLDEAVLVHDPDLGNKINLDTTHMYLVISGRLLSGDEQSAENHNDYSSSIIVLVLGEPVTNSK